MLSDGLETLDDIIEFLTFHYSQCKEVCYDFQPSVVKPFCVNTDIGSMNLNCTEGNKRCPAAFHILARIIGIDKSKELLKPNEQPNVTPEEESSSNDYIRRLEACH
jgi:hypothetical protein